jgi:hypothetical protein
MGALPRVHGAQQPAPFLGASAALDMDNPLQICGSTTFYSASMTLQFLGPPRYAVVPPVQAACAS